MATPRRDGGSQVTSRPAMVTVPESGVSSPAMIRSVVDFPHPEGPSSTAKRPGSAVKLTPSTAGSAPQALRISVNRTSANFPTPAFPCSSARPPPYNGWKVRAVEGDPWVAVAGSVAAPGRHRRTTDRPSTLLHSAVTMARHTTTGSGGDHAWAARNIGSILDPIGAGHDRLGLAGRNHPKRQRCRGSGPQDHHLRLGRAASGFDQSHGYAQPPCASRSRRRVHRQSLDLSD